MARPVFLFAIVALAVGCSDFSSGALKPREAKARPVAATATATRLPRPADVSAPAQVTERTVVPIVKRAVPAQARTAEQFDVTPRREREVAASIPKPGGEVLLGSTVASLGDPTQPGFWLRTPLVSSAGPGRVVFPGTGKSSAVALLPLAGPVTGGSRISLAAMRLVEAPLTELPTIEVYKSN